MELSQVPLFMRIGTATFPLSVRFRALPMLRVLCPDCSAAHDLPSDALGPDGRKVRCAVCRTPWLAVRESAFDLDELAEETAPLPQAGVLPASGVPPLAAERHAEPFKPEMTAFAPAARPWYDRMRPPAHPSGGWRGGMLLALALVGCLSASVAFRRTIVAAVPQTAAVYAMLGLSVNLRGLELRTVKSGTMQDNGVDVLLVQGEIANVTGRTLALPRLHLSVRDRRGLILYSWTAQLDERDLKAGQTVSFRRRLASPPPEGMDVLVRFARQAELVAQR